MSGLHYSSGVYHSMLYQVSKKNMRTFVRKHLPPILNRGYIHSKRYPVKMANGRLLAGINARSLHTTFAISSNDSSEVLDSSSQLINDSSSSLADSAQDILASGLAEPSLSSLGLGGYSPIGIIQHIFDFSHLTLGLPWWCAIVCGTVILRAAVFPIMIKTQVNAERLRRLQPELERLQEKMREAANLQNPTVSAAVTMELTELFKKHQCHPIKSLISPLVQLPLFISFFFALRGMSYLPVESMKTGGILWFTDLTAADPYYILPLLASATILLTIETGSDAAVATVDMKKMKYVFRGLCVAVFFMTYDFPTAIFTYWVSSNVITLGQALLLKQTAVRKYYGLPETPFIPPQNPNVKSGSFFDNFKAGFSNAQEAGRLEQLQKNEGLQTIKPTRSDGYQESFEYKPRVHQNEELFRKASKKR